MGASTPIPLYGGRQPTRNVEAPIKMSVKIKTVLRPNLSPTWPSTKAPTGRATYPTPKVARASRIPVAGLRRVARVSPESDRRYLQALSVSPALCLCCFHLDSLGIRHRGEVAEHPLAVGYHASEEMERLRRLKDRHTAAGKSAAA
jgi:hypothetical protein